MSSVIDWTMEDTTNILLTNEEENLHEMPIHGQFFRQQKEIMTIEPSISPLARELISTVRNRKYDLCHTRTSSCDESH